MSVRDTSSRFERACEWFIELREQQESPDVVTAWLAWCHEDPRNREAFEEARRVWSVTGHANSLSLGLRDDTATTVVGASRSRVRRRFKAGLAAALAATIAGVAILLPSVRVPPGEGSASRLKTPVGVNREVALSDGSTVALGGHSRVVAKLDQQARRLDLASGEAYFKVARDPRRPFIVSAGPIRVTALGTEFNVRTGGEHVVVAVAEGVVQIDSTTGRTEDTPRAPLRISAGETVSLNVLDASLQLAHADPTSIASWQKGRLEFTRESLGAVIESVNRYSGRPIELTDRSLAELRFTGTVFTSRLNDWVQGLPEIFPVSVREEANGIAIDPDPR